LAQFHPDARVLLLPIVNSTPVMLISWHGAALLHEKLVMGFLTIVPVMLEMLKSSSWNRDELQSPATPEKVVH
jgi:hypothetical protein